MTAINLRTTANDQHLTDISTGRTNSDLYQTKRHGPLIQKELPSLPGTTIPGPVAIAVTTDTMNTAESARYCSVMPQIYKYNTGLSTIYFLIVKRMVVF
jgi:hypothetical protein